MVWQVTKTEASTSIGNESRLSKSYDKHKLDQEKWIWFLWFLWYID